MDELILKLKKDSQTNSNFSIKKQIKSKYSSNPEKLFTYFAHPDWKIRYEIFKILTTFPYNDHLEENIIKNLHSSQEDIFYWTVKLASKNKTPLLIEEILKLLDQEEYPLSRKKQLLEFFSHNSLPKDQLERIIHRLIPFFSSREWILRKTLSDVLLTWPHKILAKILPTIPLDSHDIEYWITRTLLEIEVVDKNLEKFFLERLRSQNFEVIKLALHFLEKNRFYDTIPELLELLSHSIWSIRRFAAEILCEFGTAILNPIKIFLKKPQISEDARYWISRIIGEIPVEDKKIKKEILSISLSFLGESSPYIRSSSILTIGKLGTQKDIDKILKYHQDENVEVRKSVALALSERKPSRRGKKVLQRLMDDPDEWVVKYAKMAYHKFFDETT